MNNRVVGILAIGAVAATAGCSWKGYRDYCDKCLDSYSEDGCKAQAKSELKYAKVLGCKKEFKELSSCLGDVSSCGVDVVSCADEFDAYDECTCRASVSDRNACSNGSSG